MTTRFQLISAAYLIVLQDDHILLLQRQNTGYEDGNYSLPAGHHDEGERMKTTAARELLEETGLTAIESDLQLSCVMHRLKPDGEERIDFFFMVRHWQGALRNCEPEKCGDLRFFPAGALPENTIDFVRAGIEASLAKREYVEFGWPN